MNRTLEQDRARDALAQVRKVKDALGEGDQAQKFVSYVEALPATILANGLGQAAATLFAQGKNGPNDPHLLLFNALEKWLCRDARQAPYRNGGKLMDAIVNSDRSAYLRAQAEALAWLVWMKKFAVAFMKQKSEDGEER